MSMSLDGPGYHVEIPVLEDAAKAMDEIARKQDDFELEDLPGPAHMYGHEGVQEAFIDFCDSFDTSVELLCDKVDDMRDSLVSVAKVYREAEHSSTRGFSDPAVQIAEDS
ncbi:hypothetical protein D5S17_14620 [Pseudonocardiaceae bacterium YIM PH 21723]|nr:hypothetical protein D5S17_14620 [Pseudonocardiaceae bacterium YIM PH 21723]